MLKEFTLEQFDSHNTSFNRPIMKRDFLSACNRGKEISKKVFYPVIIHSDCGQWAKFENGEKTEWSI